MAGSRFRPIGFSLSVAVPTGSPTAVSVKMCRGWAGSDGAAAGFSSGLAQQVAPEPCHAGCIGRSAGQIGREIGMCDGRQDDQPQNDLSEAA
jgi:hypothetical protein